MPAFLGLAQVQSSLETLEGPQSGTESKCSSFKPVFSQEWQSTLFRRAFKKFIIINLVYNREKYMSTENPWFYWYDCFSSLSF